MTRKPFYTDMGPGITIRDNEGVSTPLARYAVWTWDASKGKHQVAEVGDDMEALQTKYGEGPLANLPGLAPPK